MIAGIYRPTTGAVYFGDRRVDPLHPKDRDMGMVFQSYALYPHLNLFENIAFPLRLKRVPDAEVRERVQKTADLLGIGHILERRPAQVSGGQQQRAALARALVKEPQVLLLDEPLSNLDAQIRLSARAEIRRLQRDLGVTAILVTHDQAEALAMADRVAVFSMGELQQYDTPEVLYHRPKNTFVAGFVGSPPMNLIEGEFTGDGFKAGELRLPIPGAPTGKGWLGVRPEHLALGEEGHPARVLVVEPLGREVLVVAEVGGVRLQVLLPEEEADWLYQTLKPLLGQNGVEVVVGCLADWNLRTLRRVAPELEVGFDPAFHLDVPVGEFLRLPVRTNAYGYLDDHPLGYRKVLPTPRYLADRLEATSYLVPGVREFYLRKEFVLKALDDGFNPIEHLHRLHPGVAVDVWTLDASEENAREKLLRLLRAGVDQITTNTPLALARLFELASP